MKFSVIVPVYNAEKFLKKCVDSVIAQTYSDWEIILVDDGSVDHSWEIISCYVKKDSRIRGVKQENGGPGKARNTGLENATGDYVIFLDSDDYIDPEYFELLKPKAEKSDVVFVDVLRVDNRGKAIKKETMSSYKRAGKDSFQRAMMTGKAPWGGVRKTVSLDLIRKNDIKYSLLRIGEEALYSFRIFEAAKSIDFLDERPVYIYVDHDGSQSKLTSDDPWGETVKGLKEFIKKDAEKYEKFANTLNAFNVIATIVSIDRITQMYCGAERKRRIQERMRVYLDNYDSKYGIDKKSLVRKARVLLPFVKMGITFPIVICSNLRRMVK